MVHEGRLNGFIGVQFSILDGMPVRRRWDVRYMRTKTREICSKGASRGSALLFVGVARSLRLFAHTSLGLNFEHAILRLRVH